MNLKEFFEINKKVALAFSGGVDSAYLLYAAKKYGAEVTAYFVKSAFQPEFELADAKRLAEELNADMKIIHLDVLSESNVAANPENRCYFCKKKIFGEILKAAEADGYTVILDGTNASDSADDRPGMKALAEMKVLSPLRECGLTKDQIRKLSEEAELFTWNKPAYACLATRIPQGEEITAEKLEKIEASEGVLHSMGFSNFRVRLFAGAARLQLTEDQMTEALRKREEIREALRPYFDIVLIDMEAR